MHRAPNCQVPLKIYCTALHQNIPPAQSVYSFWGWSLTLSLVISLMVPLQVGRRERSWEQDHGLPSLGKAGTSLVGSSCLFSPGLRKIRGLSGSGTWDWPRQKPQSACVLPIQAPMLTRDLATYCNRSGISRKPSGRYRKHFQVSKW